MGAVSVPEVSWNRGADGYRLPTEAEWENACRAGTETPFDTETSISAEDMSQYATGCGRVAEYKWHFRIGIEILRYGHQRRTENTGDKDGFE